MSVTHYQVLEVSPTASTAVIAAAHKALMKSVHPDKGIGHEEWAAQINAAFTVLGDAKARAAYDATLAYKPQDVVGDKYRIIGKIAEGGFGTTYKAEHLELPGSLVCVKHAGKISPEYEQILNKEARAMWDLRHHAMPAIRDYLRLPDGSVALVMSYIEGPTLHDLVEQNGPIEPEDVAWIAERILNALLYMHSYGVVHGDLKPKNVIIQPDSHHVSVVDFGLAAIRPTAQDGSIGYTEYFSPPEAKKGLPLLPQSDLYSLGATMLFALSADLSAVQRRQVPTTVPDAMCDFISRMLRQHPLERPDWQQENLMETIVSVRSTAFGRRRSGMRPIQHIRTNPAPTRS